MREDNPKEWEFWMYKHGRAEEYDVFGVFQEAHGGGQFVDLALVQRGLEAEIEVAQGFLEGKAGKLHLINAPKPVSDAETAKRSVRRILEFLKR